MSHHNKRIIDEIVEELKTKQAFNTSKQKDKIDGLTSGKIYSYSTFSTYLKECVAFGKWAQKEHKCKNLASARMYVDEYLKMKIEQKYSPYSIKLYASSLAKLYGVSTKEFITTPKRTRANITRSRKEAIRDKHINPNNPLLDVGRAMGLRRREWENLRKDDLVYKDGSYYIHVRNGKGGKERFSLVLDPMLVKPYFDKAKDGARVFGKISGNIDCHSLRRDYATTLYRRIAPDARALKPSDRIMLRKDAKGVWLSRKEALIVSQNLGHNRVSIICSHYIKME